MLSHEWRELEELCERVSSLRHRLTAAQRTKNSGLIAGLKEEIEVTKRHRELLVRHISARLGTATASRAQHDAATRSSAAAAVAAAVSDG